MVSPAQQYASSPFLQLPFCIPRRILLGGQEGSHTSTGCRWVSFVYYLQLVVGLSTCLQQYLLTPDDSQQIALIIHERTYHYRMADPPQTQRST